jgi:hypothetical protein
MGAKQIQQEAHCLALKGQSQKKFNQKKRVI